MEALASSMREQTMSPNDRYCIPCKRAIPSQIGRTVVHPPAPDPDYKSISNEVASGLVPQVMHPRLLIVILAIGGAGTRHLPRLFIYAKI